MSKIEKILDDLKEKDIIISLVDKELKIQAPKGFITPEIKNFLVENKKTIINFLAKKNNIKMDFSIFLFSDNVDDENDKYKLLLEVAKIADENNFSAIWTPERHFHKLGGIYSNPAIISAALSSITKNISLRAGSVVLPINDVIRTAENWSIIDNLSKGRVELSFATGWHINDFVFEPENYQNRKEIMFDRIEEVKKLWEGEKLKRINGANKEIEIEIHPKPYNKNLEIWVTAIGNPETYIKVGEKGYNLMTCLLDQDIEELEKKLELYFQALEKNGHRKNKKIAVFMHSYFGESKEQVKNKVKEPFKKYLKSTLDLLGKFGNASDLTINPENLTKNDKEELLEFAFERYFENRTFFGDKEILEDKIAKLAKIGVTEIACLIDFGLDYEDIIASINKISYFTK
ncbi:MAG: MupA/Atu3671 family FMN-dependent luciferase-like monooxygenase [Candidatus Sericytochromatia bacterium]